MARGYQGTSGDVKALAMKKWFNTNYHYIVPEVEDDTRITLAGDKLWKEYEEAKADTSQIGDKSIPTIQLNYHLSGTTVFNDSPVKISRCPLPSRGALLMEKNWRGKFDTPILIGSNMNRHGIHIQFHPWYNAQYGIYRHKRKNAVIAHVDGHVDATPEPISRTLHGANRYDLYYLLSAGIKDLPYLSYDW